MEELKVSAPCWEDKVLKLREFACAPGRGSVKNVEFVQTMSRIVLRHVLKRELADLTAKDLTVEISAGELKVWVERRKELDEHLVAINGDLHGEVRRDLSWWVLEKDQSGANVFTIELAKKDHKAWNTVWKIGMNNQRKSHFGWAPQAKGPVKKADEFLVRVKPGKPAPPKAGRFIMNRENLCSSMEDGQDDVSVYYRIHFYKEVLDKACETDCIGHLFGIDVMERYLKVFIRGDERSPILMGELGGACLPEKTQWEIIKAKPPPPDEDEIRQMRREGRTGAPSATPHFVSCLQITLIKAEGHCRHWPEILNQQSYAVDRDAAPSLTELEMRSIRDASPDRTDWTPQDHAKEHKAKADDRFKKGAWRDASVQYTRAINHTPNDEKLYSNRSACYIKLKKFDKSLADANKCASLKPDWPKAYFRQGQALRALERYKDAIAAFEEGRFRDVSSPDWDREIRKTEDERSKWDQQMRDQQKLKREADMTTELNEATVVAEREAMVVVAEQALQAGKSRKEAGELALKGAELAKQRVHEINAKRKAMMVEDDKQIESTAPYRIVTEDGDIHSKGFAHTDKGTYFMGMVMMNYKRAPSHQPWVEIWHPGKLRWSQGCAQIRLKVTLPESARTGADVEVRVSSQHIYIGTTGNSDPIVVGDLHRKVEPDGENYAWYLVPDADPPLLEMCLDKDAADVYQTFSYSTLLWPRLFSDDIPLGEGLFEADLTDLPDHLQEKFNRDQARADSVSLDERLRRKMMTEEEVGEETARNWNDEFARHGMPHRLDTNEDKMIESIKY